MAGKSKRDVVFDALTKLTGDSPLRFVDLQLAVYPPDGSDPLIRAGGRWDTDGDCWAGPAEMEVKIDVQRQQVLAAAAVAEWLTNHVAVLSYAAKNNCTLDTAIDVVWDELDPWYRLLLIGGRRAGKTWFACLLMVLMAIVIPGAFVVIISPTRKHTSEIHNRILGFLPANAREWRASDQVYALVNGSKIMLHTGGARSLKLGESTAVMINEGQLVKRSAYTELDGNVIDTGGMVVIAANPPDRVSGLWIEQLHRDIKANKVSGRTYSLSGRKNPYISQRRLEATAEGMSEMEARREIDGELGIPVGDIVIEGWSTTANVIIQAVPRTWVDVTAEVCERYFGHVGIKRVGGLDFDQGAGCCYATGKFYVMLDRMPGAQVADAVLVIDYGRRLIDKDEDHLVEHLAEAKDRYGDLLFADQDRILWVGDASGSWQSSERKQGDPNDLPSWNRVSKAGWRNLVAPDANANGNPRVRTRFDLARALVRPRWNGHPRIFMIAPTAGEVIESTDKYPNEGGRPHRDSAYAHLVDAWTYLAYRRWSVDCLDGDQVAALPEFVSPGRRFPRG